MSETIRIAGSVAAANDAIARQNRLFFAAHGLRVLNMVSSPGSGKTSILERMALTYGDRLAIITGDIQTTLDADRLKAAGAQAVQIETGGSCHLNAAMIQKAMRPMNFETTSLLIIENVGNLICPSTFDLGELYKVAVLSVTEGDEKPAKYPALFTRANAVIVNKIDLLPYVKFSLARARDDCRKLNSAAKLYPLSCTTGEGFEAWLDYCKALERENTGL
jgi:hydrogenase nickel incorporation protein HypB